MEQLPVQPEQFILPDEYSFMSDDSINDYRRNQTKTLHNARQAAVESDSIYDNEKIATKQLEDNDEVATEAYVAAYMNRDDNPELFDTFKNLVRENSIYNRSTIAWNNGQKDAEGNYDIETSGRNQLQAELANLLRHDAGDNTNSDQGADQLEDSQPGYQRSPEVIELDNNVVEARNALAKLSVERRRKLHRIGRKSQEKAFREATEAYEAASMAAAVGYINDFRIQGVNPEMLQARAMQLVISEHAAFTGAEKHYMEEDTTRRGRLASWLGKKNSRLFAASVVGGAAAGFGVRAGARALFGAASGAASIGTGVAVGASVGAIKSLASTRAHLFSQLDKRAKEDNEALTKNLTETGNADNVHDTYSSFFGKLKDTVQNREKSDQSANRKRLGFAALAGAVGGAGGALLVDTAVDNHWFGIGEHHGTGGSGTPNSGNNGGTTPDATQPATPAAHAGYTDGFKDHVYVEHGHGYTNELQDLAAQKGYNLNGHQAWLDYQHMTDKFNGHMFTNDHSYVRSAGDYGISRPGYANWNPKAVHYFNHLLEEQIKAGTVTKS